MARPTPNYSQDLKVVLPTTIRLILNSRIEQETQLKTVKSGLNFTVDCQQ